MPTFETTPAFVTDLHRLTPSQRERFRRTVLDSFVTDLRTHNGFRPGLRIKTVRSTIGVWELTWAPNGRATWSYGPQKLCGVPHVVWRRIGTHAILTRP